MVDQHHLTTDPEKVIQDTRALFPRAKLRATLLGPLVLLIDPPLTLLTLGTVLATVLLMATRTRDMVDRHHLIKDHLTADRLTMDHPIKGATLLMGNILRHSNNGEADTAILLIHIEKGTRVLGGRAALISI